MVGVPGIAARTFTAVNQNGCRSRRSSRRRRKARSALRCPKTEAERAVASLKAAFREELASGLIDNVTSRPGMAVVAVVGDGMVGAPGVAARVFSALAAGGINVVAIAQGSSERNISFAVTRADSRLKRRGASMPRSSSRRSAAAVPPVPHAPTSCCSASAASAVRSPIRSRAANGQRTVRVVGLLDRSGYVFEPRGISRRRLVDLAREKDAGTLLAALGGRRGAGIRGADVHGQPRSLTPRCRRCDQRRDRRSPARGARQRLSRRAREQEAARGIVGRVRETSGCLREQRPRTEVRSDGRRGAADHRHLPQARRDGRPRASRRGRASAAR